jgi:very-short-patch-repair endonuclease
MDLGRLRNVLRRLVLGLKERGTHRELPEISRQLGLPELPDTGSKSERLAAVFDAVPDADLPSVAERYLAICPPPPGDRNTIQELIWADFGPSISKRTRREVARSLAPEDLYSDWKRFDDLLYRLWVVDFDAASASSWGAVEPSLRDEVDRHVHRNPGDWNVEHLFDKLGAYDCSARRFALFLEGIVSSDVHPDEGEQRRLAATINRVLSQSGAVLKETGEEGGYPVFTIADEKKGASGRPKNIIFASQRKPDIRFHDAVNNDIELASGSESVLIYDQTIPKDGLRWRDLQAWWSEQHGVDGATAKKELYNRLLSSLPSESPPQRFLFERFFKTFGKNVPDLPALLPEVWLHWDPKTVRERGADALLRFRMDFLMLFSHAARVVIEVDGQRHYASDTGRADPMRYADMVAADRELRLSGYEVYRFGASELAGTDGEARVREFFERLFRRHQTI